MSKLIKYSYQLKTKSPVILSPRQQAAFYKDIDYEKHEVTGILNNKVNIIYPFYRRGEYKRLREENVMYYIPGSSIKGSLLDKNQKQNVESNRLLIDDIDLINADININKINKVQNTSPETGKTIKLESFFENVAMEMCKKDIVKTGSLFSRKDPTTYFENCHQSTLEKLKQWLKKIIELLNSEKEMDDGTCSVLKNAVGNVNTIIESSYDGVYLMFLGGYKGLLLSIAVTNTSEQEAIQSGLFIDQETLLPYGLVEISEVKSDE